MKYTLKKAFEDKEKVMIGNIANSLLQLYFHKHGTPKELQEYYGWDEPFAEEEREGLVNDTLRRIESEQLILKFYQKEKLKIIKKYGNKNPIGNFGRPIQRAAQHSDIKGDTTGGASQTGPGESDRDPDRSEHGGEEDHSEGHDQERGGETIDRPDMAQSPRGEGEGGEESKFGDEGARGKSGVIPGGF